MSKEKVLTRFKEWLGDKLFDEDYSDLYHAVFNIASEASIGIANKQAGDDLFEAKWAAFSSVSDAFAAKTLSPFINTKNPQYQTKLDACAEIDVFQKACMVKCIDINNAAIEELCTVPGIQRPSAERIVAYRTLIDEFHSLEQIEEIDGLNPTAIKLALPYLHCGTKQSPFQLSHPNLTKTGFISFPDYVWFLTESGFRPQSPEYFHDQDSIDFHPSQLAMLELQRIAKTVSQMPYWGSWRDANQEFLEFIDFGDDFEEKSADCDVSVLHGRSFLELGLDLIKRAEKRVYVLALHISSEKGSPGYRLIESLKQAVHRELDVKIQIMDKPEINANAIDLMMTLGISTKVFRTELLHTSTVIIDDQFVIMGSHNWTPNSIFNNIETSVCIVSESVNNEETANFEELWD